MKKILSAIGRIPRRAGLAAILLITFQDAFSYSRYWIMITDKANTPYTVGNPSAFLTARSIQRRLNQNIPITVRDLPVDPNYVAQIAAVPNVIVNYRSRWFNAISITTTDP